MYCTYLLDLPATLSPSSIYLRFFLIDRIAISEAGRQAGGQVRPGKARQGTVHASATYLEWLYSRVPLYTDTNTNTDTSSPLREEYVSMYVKVEI